MQKQPHTLEECFSTLDELLTEAAIRDIRNSSSEHMFIHQIALYGWFSNNWLGETHPLRQWFKGQGVHSTREMTQSLLYAYQRHLRQKADIPAAPSSHCALLSVTHTPTHHASRM